MNVLQTFEFAIISVPYLFTITQTIDLIAVPGEYTKKQALVLTAYMASGCICSWNRDSSHPIVFLVATMCFYSLLLIYNIMLFKTKKINSGLCFHYDFSVRFNFSICRMYSY